MFKTLLSGTFVVVIIAMFSHAHQDTMIELKIIPGSEEGCTLLPVPLKHTCTDFLKTSPPSDPWGKVSICII